MIRLKSLLSEQGGFSQYINYLNKIDPAIADLIDRINGTDFYPENTILGQTGKIIRWVPEPNSKRRGIFHIFDVTPISGIPFIREIGGISYRGQNSSQSDIKVGSTLYTDGKVPNVNAYGKTTLEQLNNIWSVSGNKSQQVLDIARQFVDRNSETFKKEFHRVTRNPWAIKTLWGDNPQPKQNLAGSQYYTFFVNKLNPLPKLIVNNIIQDDELRDHLTFKVENFNSEGKYPNNPFPVPQPVPGSGYPLA